MSAYAKQIEFLLDGVTDGTGTVLDGGLVYVWQAGTTTLATLYQDRNKLVAQTNPVVLDSEGRGIAFVDGVVKIEVRDSEDSNVFGPVDGLEYLVSTSDTSNYQVIASDYGATLDDTTLTAAIMAINLMTPNTRQLVLGTGDWNITSNFTFPSNVVVELRKGARLDIDGGVTVTFAGAAPNAGSYQIFTGSGSVSFSTKIDAHFEWFYSGSGAGYTALNALITSLAAGGRAFISTDVTVNTAITNSVADVELVGVGWPTVTLSGTNTNIFLTGANSGWRGIVFSGDTPVTVNSMLLGNSFVSQGLPTKGVYEVDDVITNSDAAEGDSGYYIVTASGGLYEYTRQNSTAYSQGDWATWSTGTTVWECVTAGTTDSSAPSISGLSYGDTVVDGSAVWAYRSPTQGATLESAKLGSKVYLNDGSTSEYVEWNSGTSKIAMSHGIEVASVDLGTNTISDGNFTGNWSFNGSTISNITSLTATTLTDGTASLTSGAWTGITNLTMSGTLDVGTNTIYDGNLTGNWAFNAGNLSGVGTIGSGAITSTGTVQGTTITDGTASMSAGALSGVTTINTTGNIYTQDMLAYSTSAGEVRQTRTGTVVNGNTIGSWTGYANGTQFSTISSEVVNTTGGSEDGSLQLSAITAGSPYEYIRIQENVITLKPGTRVEVEDPTSDAIQLRLKAQDSGDKYTNITFYAANELLEIGVGDNVATKIGGAIQFVSEAISSVTSNTISIESGHVLFNGMSTNQSVHTINLNNGSPSYGILILSNSDASETVTFTHGTGNLRLAGGADAVLAQYDTLVLCYQSQTSNWVELSRSNNS